MDAALESFNFDGIRGVSAETIIERAGVAKMTFYKHFPTKEHLSAAYVRERSKRWMAWLKERVKQLGRTPKQRLLAVFDVLAEWFESEDYRGCPFHRAAAEYPDQKHPIHNEVSENKRQLHAYFTELATDAGVPNRADLARSLMILTAGAEVMCNIEGSAAYAKQARRSAARLLSKT
ncbi:MAG TPA: TetR/AcrR family transcriptional regulator [Candidatus Tumulicola sp.]|nr:TetR/AcrR family transcriptional regulator [Candidatus Tumulicola sp.]